jgi:acyl-CoA thioester hydrolase
MDAGDGAWAVTDLNIRYRRPAKLDDDLTVVSTVDAVRGASVIISQNIERGGELLTAGRVTAAFITPDGHPRRQPQDWIDRFNRIAQGKTADL